MGNDQSKSDEERRQQRIPPSRPRQFKFQGGVTRDEVNRLLEEQRKAYERKLQELNVRSAATKNANESAHKAREANEKNIDQIIAQQLQDFVQIAYNKTPSPKAGSPSVPENKATPVTRAQLPAPSGEGPSTSTTPIVNPSIERTRSPYSFTKEGLQNTQGQTSPRTNLYPSLESAAYVQQKNTPLQQKGFIFGYDNNNSSSSDEFVFVDKNKNAQRDQSTFTPSAPPLPTGAINKNSYTPKPIPPRPKANKNDDEELNCITCGNKYGLNIFQCSKGHSSCRDCKIRLVPCGICRGPIGDTRNITLEAYISEVKLAACVAEAERKAPCPNSDDGCKLILKTADIDAHLKECPFSEILCPLAVIFGQRERCKWRGKVSQVVSHFDDIHPAHRQGNIDTEMVLINILDNNHIVHLIDLSPYIFLVHLKVADEDRKIYMTVQLLGTHGSASRWSYELHVYNKREPRRKFCHSDVCHSNTVPLEEIFRKSNCVAIPQSYALTYINEGCLNYKFYIKMDFNNAPSTSRGKWRGGGRGRGRGRGAKALK